MSYGFYKNYFDLMDPPPTKVSLASSRIPKPYFENCWSRRRLGLPQQNHKKESVIQLLTSRRAVPESPARKSTESQGSVENTKRFLNSHNSIYMLKAKPGDLNKFYLNYRQKELKSECELLGGNKKTGGKEEESRDWKERFEASFLDHLSWLQCRGSTRRWKTLRIQKVIKLNTDLMLLPAGTQGGSWLVK